MNTQYENQAATETKNSLTKVEWSLGILEIVGTIGGYKIGRSIANQAGVNKLYSVLFGIAVGGLTSQYLDKAFKWELHNARVFCKEVKDDYEKWKAEKEAAEASDDGNVIQFVKEEEESD